MSDDVIIPPPPLTARERFVACVAALIGKPVLWGAKGPDAFDCSGSVTAALYEVGGPDLRHVFNAQALYNETRELPIAESPIAGDLAFYGSGPAGIIHVATVDHFGGVISADGATPAIASLQVAMANSANRVRRHQRINFRPDCHFVAVHRNVFVDQLDGVCR